MIITWHGEGAIKIVEKETVIAINPHDSKNSKMPSFNADILLLGNESATPDPIRGTPFIVNHPGEYEVKGVFIYGISAKGGETPLTVFRLHVGEVSIGYLGGFSEDELSADLEEQLTGVDILLIPVGGKGVINSKQAVKIANQVEPRIIIPIEYKGEGNKSSRDGVESFLKEYGGAKTQPEDKLKIVKKELPQEDTKVIVISQS